MDRVTHGVHGARAVAAVLHLAANVARTLCGLAVALVVGRAAPHRRSGVTPVGRALP